MGDIWDAYRALGQSTLGSRGTDAFIGAGREVMMKGWLAQRQGIPGSLEQINAEYEVRMTLVPRTGATPPRHAMRMSGALARVAKLDPRKAHLSGPVRTGPAPQAALRERSVANPGIGDFWQAAMAISGRAAASGDAAVPDGPTADASISIYPAAEVLMKTFLARRQGIPGDIDALNEGYMIRMALVQRQGPPPPDQALEQSSRLAGAMKL